eukprot:2832127-Rhodomonas_salina.1
MAALYKTPVPWELAERATEPNATRNHKITVFFVLLNVDIDLKNILVDLCPHKAGGFYQEINNTIIPQWLKDETHSLETL